MELRRQSQKNLGEVIKKDIQDQDAQQKMTELIQNVKAARYLIGRLDQITQAGCTKNFIFMFRDTLAAIILTALGTTSHRLPLHMIVTTLMRNIEHARIQLSTPGPDPWKLPFVGLQLI